VWAALREGGVAAGLEALEAGANPQEIGPDGDSMTNSALFMKDLSFLDALLAKGADPAFQAPGHLVPLHLAAITDQADAVTLLLQYGAPVHQTDQEGLKVTPLHAAAAGGAMKCARVLLDAGADVNARAKGGRTPLHFAYRSGHGRVVDLLVAAGGDPDLEDEEGLLPCDLWSSDEDDDLDNDDSWEAPMMDISQLAGVLEENEDLQDVLATLKARQKDEEPRLKVVWAVCDHGGSVLKTYPYQERKAAETEAARLQKAEEKEYHVRSTVVPM